MKQSGRTPCSEQARPAPSREGGLQAETERLLLIAAAYADAYADNEIVRVTAGEPTATGTVSGS
ncbi:hypothetical protein GCM10010353_60740 [Streptomyces chryseus]|uniref:Uncharacterized protein n=1 Tax=Streptomyces chryseus TaxID=68186 RepID=A0ABQ3E7H8_9ACTN|nr:hypothetical protein GCM10010353_60740 [Streptomyces chryseus]GHB25903.1 hypothetical protein GCM10010346_56860 [Streptomyces chryseus]